MNDPLAAAIAQAILAADDNPAWELGILGHEELGKVAATAARAWLALPPSEAEIEAAAIAFVNNSTEHAPWDTAPSSVRQAARDICSEMLVASRAVLVRPPEGEKEPS